MNQVVQVPFGFSEIRVGEITVFSIRLNTKTDFPIDDLPWGFSKKKRVDPCGIHIGYSLLYQTINLAMFNSIKKQVGTVLKKHATAKLESRYAYAG